MSLTQSFFSAIGNLVSGNSRRASEEGSSSARDLKQTINFSGKAEKVSAAKEKETYKKKVNNPRSNKENPLI